MRRLFITLAIAIVVIVMFLAAVIVRFEPAVAMAGCWPNNAMLAIAVASASVGCCLGVAPRGVPRTAPLAPSAWAAPLAGRDGPGGGVERARSGNGQGRLCPGKRHPA